MPRRPGPRPRAAAGRAGSPRGAAPSSRRAPSRGPMPVGTRARLPGRLPPGASSRIRSPLTIHASGIMVELESAPRISIDRRPPAAPRPPPRARAGAGLHEQQERPEDRRRPELPVEPDPVPDARPCPRRGGRARPGPPRGRTLPAAVQIRNSCSSARSSSPVARSSATSGSRRHSRSRPAWIPRVGGGERVLERRRERERGVRAFGGAIGLAEHPQGERRGREARDARVVADARGPGRGRPGREQGDGLFEVVEPGLEVVEAHQRRADQEVAVDQHGRVALRSPRARISRPISRRLVELRAEQVQAGEAAQHGELLARRRRRARTAPGRRAKAASTSGVKPFVAISARASVVRSAISWSIRSGDVGTASTTASMSDASPTVSRYQPWASSRISSALASLSSCSRSAASTQYAQAMRRFATSASSARSAVSRPDPPRSARSRLRQVREVRRRAPGASATRRPVAGRAGRRRTRGSSRASRRAARRPARRPGGGGSSRRARPARRGRRTAMPSIGPDVVGHRLDRRDLGVGEHRQQLEQALLAGLEELVAPVDRRAQRLLALGKVARSAAQQAEPVAEPVPQHLRREQARGARPRARSPAAGRRAGGRSRRPPRRCRRSARSPGGPTRARSTNSWTASDSPIRPRRWPAPRPAAAGRAAGPGRPARPGRGAPRGWWPGPSAPGSRSAAGDDAGRLGHLLEVVEHEQHPPLAQAVGQLVLEVAIDDLAQPDRPGDRDEDGVGVAGARQVHERHAVAEPGARSRRRGSRASSCPCRPARSASAGGPIRRPAGP